MKVIIGIDLGSWTFKICAYNGQSFQILTNQANFRQTPNLVSFLQAQRLVGEEALNKIKSNYMNTVRAPHRLIGLQKNFQLIEEELKYSTANYDTGQQLHFSIQIAKNKNSRLQPQHLLISLLSKICGIVLSHNLDPHSYYLVVPSYFSHYQRKIIRRCGEIVLQSSTIFLVDDWVSLAAQYAYSHQNQVRTGLRTIIFMDIGYSKCSFFVVQFTASEPRLLDCQHMRYVGSKNMDHLIAQYYNQKIVKNKDSTKTVFASHKSKVKLMSQIEKQRKILSANEESFITVQELFQDFDLNYSMRRKQFEKIVQPALTQIRKGLQKIRDRMPANYHPHSLQLLGGASRIPYIRTIIKNVFNIQPSRTLNSSQSTARGASIYGAIAQKAVNFAYHLPNYNLIDICISWNKTSLNDFYGENAAQYKNKVIIFKANSSAPSQYFLPIGNDGPIQLYIYYGQAVSTKSIGYLRFNSPNRLKFILDSSKIVNVQLQRGDFTVCKMQDKKESKWSQIQKWQLQIRTVQQRVKLIYEIKNQYQSKFYWLRTNLANYKDFMSQEQFASFVQQFRVIQEWIDKENNRPLSTAQDLELYQQQIEKIKSYQHALNVLKERKNSSGNMNSSVNIYVKGYQYLRKQIQSIQQAKLNQWQTKKIALLAQWLQDSFNKMKQTNWEGYYLTESSLSFAQNQLKRILSMKK